MLQNYLFKAIAVIFSSHVLYYAKAYPDFVATYSGYICKTNHKEHGSMASRIVEQVGEEPASRIVERAVEEVGNSLGRSP